MAFEELKENTENIKEEVQGLFEKNLAYYRLRTFKLAMKSVTMVFKFTLIVTGFCIVLLFLSVALAFALGNYFGSYGLGFLCVGLIYIVLTGLLFLIKDRFLEGPILAKFSDIFFND